MARLPSAVNIQTVGIRRDPGLRVPNTATTGAALVQAGQFLGGVVDAVYEQEQQQKKKFDASVIAEATLAADKRASDEYQRVLLEEDASSPDFIKKQEEWLQKRNQEILANLPPEVSEAARQDLQFKLAQDANTWAIQYTEDSVVALDRRSKSAFEGVVAKYEAMASRDPARMTDILAMANDELDSFRGTMKADTESEAFKASQGNIINATFDSLIAKGEYGRAKEIIDSGRYDEYIDVNSFNEKVSQSIDKRLASLDRAQRMSDRREQEISDEVTKTGVDLAASGDLTLDWVQANRDILSLADYRALSKAATVDTQEDDRQTVADLYYDMGQRVDVSKRVLDAYSDGLLTRGTMTTILSRNDTVQGRSGAQTPFEAASNYLNAALRPSDLNDNPDAAAAYANAESDLMDWFDENPQATVKQAKDIARELAGAYRLAPGTSLSLPFPDWMAGDRNIREPDLDATEQSIIRDLSAGTISQAEAIRRAKTINRWREFQQESAQ